MNNLDEFIKHYSYIVKYSSEDEAYVAKCIYGLDIDDYKELLTYFVKIERKEVEQLIESFMRL